MTESPILEKGLPCNTDAERLVLGSILTDPEAARVALSLLSPDDFYLEKHRKILRHCLGLQNGGRQIDRITLTDSLQDANELESVDGFSYVVSLDDGLPTIHNLDGYIQIVREKAIARRLIYSAQALIDKTLMQRDSISELLADADRAYRELTAATITKHTFKSFPDFITEYEGGFNAFLDPPVSERGVPLPWSQLNDLIPGMRPGEMIVLGARPSLGKTAFAGAVGLHAAELGHPTGIISLEMGQAELWHRVIAGRAQVDLHRFKRGRLDELERFEVQRGCADLENLPLYLAEIPGCTPASIYSAVQTHNARRPKLRLLIVDYIQLMRLARRSERRTEEVSEISRSLKIAARELDLAMLVLAQLNRETTKTGERPDLHHIRESGAIEQDADIVAFLWIDPSELANPVRTAEVLVRKHRNGPVGKVKLTFHAPFMRFTEEQKGDLV